MRFPITVAAVFLDPAAAGSVKIALKCGQADDVIDRAGQVNASTPWAN